MKEAYFNLSFIAFLRIPFSACLSDGFAVNFTMPFTDRLFNRKDLGILAVFFFY